MYTLQSTEGCCVHKPQPSNLTLLVFFGLLDDISSFFPSGGGGMSNLTVNATETINKWSTHFQFH